MSGVAAVHRCDNCIALNAALAAEGTAVARKRLFPQAVKRWAKLGRPSGAGFPANAFHLVARKRIPTHTVMEVHGGKV